MSDIPKRYEYYLSPDGVRKLSQLMKNHFDGYPSKDKLYNDSNGLQYNGSVYNFGSEILMETNKLKMTRPPIRNLSYGKDTTFYFDIKYSNIINTYEQQNMLCCFLKKDVLVASHKYYIAFNNVTEFFVIRSTNTSAGNTFNPSKGNTVIFKDIFYKTTDFPILIETYEENGETITIEHELSIRDGESTPTFYFHSNDLTDAYIDSIVDDTLSTIELIDEYNGLPFIWFTTESFEYLPKLDLSDNIDQNGHPFLTFGTDGNGTSRIYPNCYENNFPPHVYDEHYEWYLKVEARDGYSFIPDDEPGDKSANYQIPIKSISLWYARLIESEPSVIKKIEVPIDSDVVVTLDDCSTYFVHSYWYFKKRTPSDWDWDPITFHNPNYAWHVYETQDQFRWTTFAMNHMDEWPLCPGFRIKFLNDYLYKWESKLVGTVSGIHIDATDERSNNGIVEKYGVSHMMGEFDGLPSYMGKQLDRTIHHSHVDIYSIRDHNNLWTQQPMKKQTSGLLLDSAIPQNELPELISVDPSIKYNNIVSNQYDTDTDTIVSMYNVLSNITYVDTETNVFADYTNKGNKKYKRFFYHGSNYFSLDVFGLDPLTEYARGYVISNDGIKYENNDESPYPKPKRTIARICDIPTSMLQLTNVPDYAPSILIDWNTSDLPYVRTLCNYEINDVERLRNNPYDVLIKYNDIVEYDETNHRYNEIIFPNGYDLSGVLTYTGDYYKHKSQLSETLTLTFGDGGNTTMVVNTAGSGYNVNDKFKFNIGGRYFTGTVVESVAGAPTVVTTIDDDGVPDVSIDNINVSNLPNAITTYHTTTIEGSGDGLIINLEIDSDIWNGKQPKVDDNYIDGLYLYQYDEYGHVWIHSYDNDHGWDDGVQVTGPSIIPNPYDLIDLDKRKMVNVYIMNLVNNNRKLLYNTPISVDSTYSMMKRTIETDIPTSDIGMDDISGILNDKHINYQNTYYTPVINGNETDINLYTRYPYTYQDNHYGNYHSYVLPRFNTLNIPSYFNTTNRILWSIHKDKTYSQPDLWYYNPNETNFVLYDNVSTDYHSIKSSRKLSYYDIMKDQLTTQGSRFIAKENIYRYNECESDSFNELQIMLNGKTRDELLVYIRDNCGPDAFPLKVETINPFTKSMLVGYCLTIPPKPYSKSSIKMVAQQYTTVAQRVESSEGTETIVPTGGEPVTGMFEPLSYSIHDLNYTTTNEMEPSILFVFTIMKNDQLVSFKHFHMYDENGIDISKMSLLIYDGDKYLFDEETDNWRQPI